MATISPKQGFSVATVARGWSLVYMLMRIRYLIVFFTLETIKNVQEVTVRSLLFTLLIKPTPDNSNLQRNSKKVRVIGSSKKIAGSKEKLTVFTAQ